MKEYDFSGWATKNNLKCSDGRTIMKDAFIENDGCTVPLVWNHDHNSPENVIGHALLKNEPEGVRAYGKFNDTDSGRHSKAMIINGDINSMSIYANKLKQVGSNVMHGIIREVSLVLAGANPGAKIDSILAHGAGIDEDGGIIYTGESIELYHSEETKEENSNTTPDTEELSHNEGKNENNEEANMADEEKKTPEEGEKSVQDVIDSMNKEQQEVLYGLLAAALESDKKDDNSNEGEKEMKHNVFNTETNKEEVLTHSEEQAIFADAKRSGSLKEAVLQHGITNIDYLFPEHKTLTKTPEFINTPNDWVSTVMNGVHKSPFSRIKSVFADITGDEARARGYMKGNKKEDEVFTLLKRTTDPTTIYKKQSFDRDDIIDITDFDMASWVKAEMRMKLNEEIARAILVGDGRMSSSNDKIDPLKIRPIWGDNSLYTINKIVDKTSNTFVKDFIKACIKARKDYRGSGSPVMYITEDMLTECLLLEDTTGRVIYDTEAKLATALRVSKLIPVPVMEVSKRTEEGFDYSPAAIIVNLSDYNVGADKGGAVSLFDDFDIDYNKEKYLIETRCSGALTKPYSAITIEVKSATVAG